ncbi:type II toxin-antitoxin system RelE/ParE family toxin [Nonomuraea sp. NPDC046570]|uniref:type II toxin-antitoxin system RelE/ParE family toxin n=1 Tax=Nonomuraea sp. NPDC046570 TaxID=3155255 RepID=UPI0033F74A8B
MWKLEIVEPVRDWLRTLRKENPRLAREVAGAIDVLMTITPAFHRPLVDSLAGDTAKSIGLKELRVSGTIRIAFVAHRGTIVLLLSHGDKRNTDSRKFYDGLIITARERYQQWLIDKEDE